MPTQGYASLIDIASSWSDIAVAITPYAGTKLDAFDIAAISHSGTVELGEQRGTSGGRVTARTTGSASNEASITFYRRGLLKLVDALVAAAPAHAIRGNQIRMSLIGFDVDVQHSPPGETRISHVRIKGCRLLGWTDDMSEGNEADQIEMPLSPIEIAQVLPDGREVVLL